MFSTMFLIACVIFIIAYVAFRETWHRKRVRELTDHVLDWMGMAKHNRELLDCAQVVHKCFVCGRYVSRSASDSLRCQWQATM